MFTCTTRNGLSRLLMTAALAAAIGLVYAPSALAHGGGGGHGGGGFGGGFGGHMGGFGGGVGHFGGLGYGGFGGRQMGYGGYGYGRGLYGMGYGYGLGYGLGLGYGGGWPYYGYGGYAGYGYGWPYSGTLGGYGWPYYGYAYTSYPNYGYNYTYPYSGYSYGYPYDATSYGYPYSGNAASYPTTDTTFGYSSAYVPPGASRPIAANADAQGKALGVVEKEVVDAAGNRGMEITRVYPGSAAEKAGLHAGDVIYSANGYLTEVPGNLAWVISNATPTNVLSMVVRSANDGRKYTYTVNLP
jgi:hypothetical protein